MANMPFWSPTKHQDVVNVYEGSLLCNARDDDVHGALKRFRCILKSKGPYNKSG